MDDRNPIERVIRLVLAVAGLLLIVFQLGSISSGISSLQSSVRTNCAATQQVAKNAADTLNQRAPFDTSKALSRFDSERALDYPIPPCP